MSTVGRFVKPSGLIKLVKKVTFQSPFLGSIMVNLSPNGHFLPILTQTTYKKT